MTRILIAGSRRWSDEDMIWRVLHSHVGDVTVVHGDCPTGADAIADKVAKRLGFTIEAHPADWSLGKSAGPQRNSRMVDLGADVCYAFPTKDSRGAVDCINKAVAAGIRTEIYWSKNG